MMLQEWDDAHFWNFLKDIKYDNYSLVSWWQYSNKEGCCWIKNLNTLTLHLCDITVTKRLIDYIEKKHVNNLVAELNASLDR